MTDDKKAEVKNPYWKPGNDNKWERPQTGSRRTDYGAPADPKREAGDWIPELHRQSKSPRYPNADGEFDDNQSLDHD